MCVILVVVNFGLYYVMGLVFDFFDCIGINCLEEIWLVVICVEFGVGKE